MSSLVRARPSAASRWFTAGCRGSVALSSQFEDRSEDGEEGTRLHDLAAKAFYSRTRNFSADDGKVINPYLDEVWKEQAARPNASLYIERPVKWALHPDLEGTPDAVLVDLPQETVIIWDFKTGWRLVEVVENPQLLSYAIMIAKPQWTVDLRIVQPLPYHPNGPVRRWVVSWSELQRRAVQIADALREVRRSDAPLVAGPHCLGCTALVACPAARNAALGAIDRVDSPTQELPPEHLGRELRTLRDAAKMMELRIAALEEEIAFKIRSGANIPGVYLRENSGGRLKWKYDEENVRKTLQFLLGKDVAVPKIPTPTQLQNSGVSRELLQPLTLYQSGKMVVSTDPDDRAAKVFVGQPNMEYQK